jgi:hypothetical protein
MGRIGETSDAVHVPEIRSEGAIGEHTPPDMVAEP